MKMSLRFSLRILLALVIVAPSFFTPEIALAAPFLQDDDPVTQCAIGVDLFIDNKNAEAFPLLEAGFTNRGEGNFTDPDNLGKCALALGILYKSMGNNNEALSAYEVALLSFKSSNNKSFEGKALNNIGLVYQIQGRYDEALENYQQALVIQRKAGNRNSEGTVLNGIGAV